jgi:two-component system NtrC family sensor kinase
MKKGFKFDLATKFMLVSSLIMALSSVTWGGWFWFNESRHLLERMEVEGGLLLNSVQGPIIDAIVYERIGVIEENANLLDNFVEQLMDNRQLKVVYAFITDRNGKAVAHSDYRHFGRVYRDPLTAAALRHEEFVGQEVSLPGGRVYDMALPLQVAGKGWGALRVGVSMAAVEEARAALKREILIFTGLFFLIGNLIFYIVGVSMSRPLQRLSRAMAGVHGESLDADAVSWRYDDEIGQLQRSFQEMLARLKQAEQERQRAVARLMQNEKLATMGKIVAGVAHEINNPLMVMTTSLFQLEKKAPPELTRYVALHKEGIQRIETIVRQLTDFSRVGTLDLQRMASDQFFRETAGFAAIVLKKFPVEFQTSDDAQPTTLSLDKGKMHQVVLNLLLNAADASPEGGAVQLIAYLHDGSYHLAVRDHGAGVAPQDLERIFEIFYTTKPGGEGTGIGLAISKSIVEMHRGEITCESSPGETTFVVRIPLEQGGGNG